MQKIRASQSDRHDPCGPFRQHPQAHRAGPAQAQRLRDDLTAMAQAAATGSLALAVARPEDGLVRGAPGHFHLSAELFLQCAGHTDFHFPTGSHRLEAGQALLVPARVLHDERIAAAGPAPAQAFRNLVLHVEEDVLSCHLAHEQPPGRPAVLHLESLRHPQARRLHDWLADAARLGHSALVEHDPWAGAQARALVTAALAATLRLLGPTVPAGATPTTALPERLARAHLLLANQLGEQGLSVRSLAAQCGCSPDHLTKLFARHHGGQTLKARMLQLRLERAAQLLADTPLSVKEVAWASGFSGASHFIHSFRRCYGTTPLGWRAAQRHLTPSPSG
jgi:AraC-like DNA-binding protein/mannose-6-phosphate isomerase-like protein (cupin superfamily)